jgi:alpha,alpha-trehalase
LAEAELWDFTPRFDRRAADFCPVDLNAVLYAFEENMAYGNRVLGRDDEKHWMERAAHRRALVQRLLWNDGLGCYVDYDAVKRAQADLISAATLFPLAAGMATPEQAERVVRVSRHKLECAHGVATCEERKHPYLYQWDYPNGWPCLQVIAIQAFDRYGFHADARRVAEKYVNTVIRNFRTTGDLWEKYNVVTGTIEVADEYPMPRMVGWTAGAFVFALDYLMQSEPENQMPKKDGGAGR